MGWQAGSNPRPGGAPGPEERLPGLPGGFEPGAFEPGGFEYGGGWAAVRPSAALAAALEAAAGPGGLYDGADTGALVGIARQWAAVESWAAAGLMGSLRAMTREDGEGRVLLRRRNDLPEGWDDSLNYEVAQALAMGPVSAGSLAALAWALGVRLPGIGRLLADGTLTKAKAKLVAAVFEPLTEDEAARAEALIVSDLAGKTYFQVERLAWRAALAVAPDVAGRRRRAAERERARVTVFREESGAVGLSGRDLPAAQALAGHASVAGRAREYEASGAFPGQGCGRLEALAYLHLLNGVSAGDAIAFARAAATGPPDSSGPDGDGGQGDGPRDGGGGPGDPGDRGGREEDQEPGWADGLDGGDGGRFGGRAAPEPPDGGPGGDSDTRSPRDGDGGGSGDAPGRPGDCAEHGAEDPAGRGSDADGPAPGDDGQDRAGGAAHLGGHGHGGDDDGRSGDNGRDGGGGSDGGGRGPGDDCHGSGDDGGPGDGGPGGSGPGAGGGHAVLPEVTVPLVTLLRLAERPGDNRLLGPFDPALARDLAAAAARSAVSRWEVTVVDDHGYAVGHGIARPGRERQRPPPSPDPCSLPARVNITVTEALLRQLAAQAAPRAQPRSGAPPGDWELRPKTGGVDGRWTLTLPGGRPLTVRFDVVPTHACDHRYEAGSYEPGERLRRLVQVRDYECTFPTCSRPARESDFEHAVPYDHGGRTDACNAGARSRRCHQVKQSPGWTVTQPKPGWHMWTTPTGRTYTQEPWRYIA